MGLEWFRSTLARYFIGAHNAEGPVSWIILLKRLAGILELNSLAGWAVYYDADVPLISHSAMFTLVSFPWRAGVSKHSLHAGIQELY